MKESFETKFSMIQKEIENEETKEFKDNTYIFDQYIKLISNRPLILYGCGMGGYTLADWLSALGVKISGFADSKRKGIFPFSNTEIISMEELQKNYKEFNILISSKKYDTEIYSQLIGSGFSKEQVFTFPKLFPHLPTKERYVINQDLFLKNHIEGYKWAYNFFEDEESKRIVVDRLKCQLYGTVIKASPDSLEYFDYNIISLSKNEIFVDGGAYYGDTILAIDDVCKGEYQHIYSFEADTKKCEMMQKEFVSYNRVSVVDRGLWSENSELNFSKADFGASSSIACKVSEESERVEVVSLDSFFLHKEAPTFIKMDIEGAEYEALQGAKEIICKYKPKLAICIYHKPEDVYTIPQLLKEYRKDYKFYLRQPYDGTTETILYVV